MLELNKLYCENCIDTMSRMPDGFIDLTVTSPPYNNLRNYKGYLFDFESIAKELFRVTKTGGVVVWVVGDATINGSETGTSFRQALYFMERGFNLHDTMIYAKENFIPLSHNRYEQAFEYMFVLSRGSPSTFNPIKIPTLSPGKSYNLKRRGYGFKEGAFRRRDDIVTTNEMKVKGNIFVYPCGNSGNNHPAVFPEKLASDQIKSWSNEGDLIYDPFMGSGTTAKIAHFLKRNWIGSEISKEYVNLAIKRIQPYLDQKRLF